MQTCSLFLVASLLAGTVRASSPKCGVQWRLCDLSSTDELNTTRPILCGSLSVPLDYSDPNSANTINLPLLKIAAADNVERKGSILLNFGGPGINGTEAFAGLGARLHGIIGPNYDLITWHPRGTNGDLLFSCYSNSTTRFIAKAITTPRILGNASDVADGRNWASGGILYDTCGEFQKENGSLVGTAYTARDAMQIVDALDDDGLIRYWGFSYGTVLGSTIAAMFPSRIDKMIIDGVTNARSYYHGLVLTSRESSNDVLRGFAQGCVLAAEHCSLAHKYTAKQVYNNVLRTIDSIRASPAVVRIPFAAADDFILDYTSVKDTIYQGLYSPEAWSGLADFIEAVATRNSTFLANYVASRAAVTSETDDEAAQAIQCSDTFARASTMREAMSYFQPFRTNIFSDVDDPTGFVYARWPFAAKERYGGNFEVKTRYPLLVIGNTWDPATPLTSARNASIGFEGSVLLEQRGYGHTSTAQASLCTARRVRDYFKHGILPDRGTICSVDERLFSDDHGASSWAHVLKSLAEENQSSTTGLE